MRSERIASRRGQSPSPLTNPATPTSPLPRLLPATLRARSLTAAQWLSCVCLLLLHCCAQSSLAVVQPEALPANLLLRPLSVASSTCNDGSPALYYADIRPSSSEWVVAFPGGGACFDLPSCTQRWQNPGAGAFSAAVDGTLLSITHSGSVDSDLYLMSSHGAPDAIVGRTLLSAFPVENPRFASANKVYVLYCSSDFWLGDSSAAFDNSSSTPSSPSSFAMRGASIVRSVISDLLLDPLGLNQGATLRTATSLVLVGSSAGALGVLHHLSSISDAVVAAHVNASLLDVRAIVDSGWFTDSSNGFAATAANAIALYNMSAQSDYPCLDISSAPSAAGSGSTADSTGATSCCFLASCLVQNAAVSGFNRHQRPVLVVNSLNDAFLSAYRVSSSSAASSVVQQLSQALDASSPVQNVPLNDVLTAAVSLLDYGASVNESARMVATNTQLPQSLHFFLVSCVSHGLLMMVDDEQTATLGPLSQLTDASVWSTLSTRNRTLQEAISLFVDFEQGGGAVPLYLVDAQHNNPSCPEKYAGEALSRSYPFATTSAANRCIGVVAVALLVLPLLVFAVLTALIHCRYRPGLRDEWKVVADSSPSQHRPRFSVSSVPRTVSISLSTKGLTYYPSKDALQRRASVLGGVSVRPMRSGQLVGVIANSGGGKSTLLELLSCRRTYGRYTGHIVLDGCGVEGEESVQRWMRDNASFVGQSGGCFLSNLTVLANLQHAASIRLPHLSRRLRMRRIYHLLSDLKLLGVQHKRTGEDDVAGASTTAANNSLGSISGGQRRRLALAIELLSEVPIIVMDEPTASLDSSAAHRLLHILRRLADTQNTLIIVSIHQARSEILSLFSSVLLLAAGSLVYQGTPSGAVRHFQEALRCCHSSAPQQQPDELHALQLLMAESDRVGQGVNPADFLVDCLSNSSVLRQAERMPVEPDTTVTEAEDGSGSLSVLAGPTSCKAFNSSAVSVAAPMSRAALCWRTANAELQVALAMQSRRLLSMSRAEEWELFLMALGVGALLGDIFWQCGSHLSFGTCLVLSVSVSVQTTCSHVVESWYRSTKLYTQEVYGRFMQPRRLLLLLLPHHAFYGLLPVVGCCFVLVWTLTSPLSSALFDSGAAGHADAWTRLLQTLLVQAMAVFNFHLLFAFLSICLVNRIDLSAMQQVSCVLMAGALLLSGFLIMPSQLPFWLSLFGYVNPLHWAFLALLRINLPSSVACQSGQSAAQCAASQFDDGSTGWLALAYYGAGDVNEFACLAILVCQTLLWTAASYVALRRFSTQTRTASSSRRSPEVAQATAEMAARQPAKRVSVCVGLEELQLSTVPSSAAPILPDDRLAASQTAASTRRPTV